MMEPQSPEVVPGSDEDLLRQAGLPGPDDVARAPGAGSQLPPGLDAPPAEPPTPGPAQQRRFTEAKAQEGEKPPLDKEEAQDLLDIMLAAEAPPPYPEDDFIIRRPDGSLTAKIRLRGIPEDEMDLLAARCWRTPTDQEKKAGVTATLVRDMSRLKRLTTGAGMIQPLVTDSRLLAKYGPRPEDVVTNWLLTGEIDKISDAVNDLSGWSEDALTKAKGS
jgi:hypothetical protein